MWPAYLDLLQSGELAQRVEQAWERLQHCDLCPWECRKDRLAGKKGACWTAARARVASYGPHLGEEAPLSGWQGSGTIFFARCNMNCQYCQNYDLSTTDAGDEVEPAELSAMMLALQARGCHNINLVSPTHVLAQILAAVQIAAGQGLRLPLVYNTGGYDSVSALQLLDGVVDIYMPDMKYASAQAGLRYSRVRNYPSVNQAAVHEMHRQVGDLQIAADGLARRGLLVRHLVLPTGLAGSPEIARFLAEEISPYTYVNLMAQYHPAYRAAQHARLARRPTEAEYTQALLAFHQAGLHRLDA